MRWYGTKEHILNKRFEPYTPDQPEFESNYRPNNRMHAISNPQSNKIPNNKKINQTTQRIVGIIFFLLIAFLIVPQFMQGPPKVPLISPTPIEPKIDTTTPRITVNVDQEGTILPPVDPNASSKQISEPIIQPISSQPANDLTKSDTSLPKIELGTSNDIPIIPTNIIKPEPVKTAEPVKTTEPAKTTEPVKTAIISKPEPTNAITKPEIPQQKQVNKTAPANTAKLPAISLVSVTQLPTNTNTKSQKNIDNKPTKPQGTYAVQAGVFSQQTNANDIYQKLKSAGYPASILRAGTQFKVRVGPFSSEATARATMSKLQKSGHATSLIKP